MYMSNCQVLVISHINKTKDFINYQFTLEQFRPGFKAFYHAAWAYNCTAREHSLAALFKVVQLLLLEHPFIEPTIEVFELLMHLPVQRVSRLEICKGRQSLREQMTCYVQTQGDICRRKVEKGFSRVLTLDEVRFRVNVDVLLYCLHLNCSIARFLFSISWKRKHPLWNYQCVQYEACYM